MNGQRAKLVGHAKLVGQKKRFLFHGILEYSVLTGCSIVSGAGLVEWRFTDLVQCPSTKNPGTPQIRAFFEFSCLRDVTRDSAKYVLRIIEKD